MTLAYLNVVFVNCPSMLVHVVIMMPMTKMQTVGAIIAAERWSGVLVVGCGARPVVMTMEPVCAHEYNSYASSC